MITALVLFKAEKGKISGLANKVGAIDEVVEVLSITGEYDLMAKIQVQDYENLADIVTEKMQNMEGVLSTRTMMAFKTYKFHELIVGAPSALIMPEDAPETAMVLENGKKTIAPILAKLTEHFNLDKNEINNVIDAINAGQLSDVQIAGFLVGLLCKGPSIKEVAHIAQAMRRNCVPIKVSTTAELTDTCGTGGGLTTFNVSTANAIMAASAGIPVAKHGSRSISSSSGSADVLEALGVNIDRTTGAGGPDDRGHRDQLHLCPQFPSRHAQGIWAGKPARHQDDLFHDHRPAHQSCRRQEPHHGRLQAGAG